MDVDVEYSLGAMLDTQEDKSEMMRPANKPLDLTKQGFSFGDYQEIFAPKYVGVPVCR
jgi:hypothetical protein